MSHKEGPMAIKRYRAHVWYREQRNPEEITHSTYPIRDRRSDARVDLSTMRAIILRCGGKIVAAAVDLEVSA